MQWPVPFARAQAPLSNHLRLILARFVLYEIGQGGNHAAANAGSIEASKADHFRLAPVPARSRSDRRRVVGYARGATRSFGGEEHRWEVVVALAHSRPRHRDTGPSKTRRLRFEAEMKEAPATRIMGLRRGLPVLLRAQTFPSGTPTG